MNTPINAEIPLTIEDIMAVAAGAELKLGKTYNLRARIDHSRRQFESILSTNASVYGVNTGFGDSCTTSISPDLIEKLPINITRYHSCGLGRYFSPKQVRAIQAVRLASLCSGYSAISFDLLEALAAQINFNITPAIPEEGSVGASGDLTPLAYLASSLIGEGDVLVDGELKPSLELYAKLDLVPYRLKPKEGLALMNGTAVMTALACESFHRANTITNLACLNTGLTLLGLKGNPEHFALQIFKAKPHPGQFEVAQKINRLISNYQSRQNGSRIQDRYSVRCAPHVIGVLADFMPSFRKTIETEINSANDNPLFDPETSVVLHGGNFYGGHIAFVMDSMKTLVANIGDLLDRQIATLIDPKMNNGLPPNLVGIESNERSIHHGFKALQISISAWTAEALKLTMPASVFSRSTECHNQDKVSMGTIAARDCLRVLELVEQIVASSLIIANQACYLRIRKGELAMEDLGPQMLAASQLLDAISPPLISDRALDKELRHLIAEIREGKFNAIF